MSIAVKAIGCRLVLRSKAVEDPTVKKMQTMGLALAPSIQKDIERAQAGIDKGEVLDIGPACSEQYIQGIKVGDTVAFAKYAGKVVTALDDPEDKYLIINDEDVVATFRSANG